MSMDYPDYLRIRQKSKLLGFLWVIGDIGYYIIPQFDEWVPKNVLVQMGSRQGDVR